MSKRRWSRIQRGRHSVVSKLFDFAETIKIKSMVEMLKLLLYTFVHSHGRFVKN